jgi:hypothetical protein
MFQQQHLIVLAVVAAVILYTLKARESFMNYGPARLVQGYDDDELWQKHMVWKHGKHLDRNTTHNMKRHEKKRDFCHRVSSSGCRIPPVGADVCYRNEYQNCNYEMRPGDHNKYRQCTNNNLNVPNNLPCECGNRGYDVCLPRHRMSEACYSDSFNKCMAARSVDGYTVYE